jgi:3-hydroxyacyl-[acyl-carrier-protein] dehydratase
VRFILVDRILAVEAGRSIEVVKNVAATEDIFTDHFPRYPVFPGALVVEVFEQAVQLLIGISGGFSRVGRLERVSRASFRRLVRPGDQLKARCQRRDADGMSWRIAASAEVNGSPVAAAVLQYALVDVVRGTEGARQAERVAELARVLRQDPLSLAAAVS